MSRRLHISDLRTGEIALAAAQAHHARDVLRLAAGEVVELFDDAGATADGIIMHCSPSGVAVHVTSVRPAVVGAFQWIVASAVPKGTRGDWMIEKLGELGTAAFIPLLCARSVVTPEGKNKLQRWQRLAEEASRQSRRAGVMRIEPPTQLQQIIAQTPAQEGWVLSTAKEALPIRSALTAPPSRLTLFVGPEGGWTDPELAAFITAGMKAITVAPTILRVETAAVAIAALVAALLAKPANE